MFRRVKREISALSSDVNPQVLFGGNTGGHQKVVPVILNVIHLKQRKKMEDNTRIFVKAGVIITIVFFLTVGGCCVHQDYRISQAIEQGGDPILVRQAYENCSSGHQRMIYVAVKAMANNDIDGRPEEDESK